MKRSHFYGLGLGVLLLGLVPTSARGINIDLFEDVDETNGFQVVQDGTTDSTPVSDTDGEITPLTGVLGGQRTLEVNKLSGNFLVDTLLYVDTAESKVSLSSDDVVKPNFSITWDGDFDGAGSNNYIDLTENDTNDSFVINIITNDLGVDLNFEVSDGTNTATLTQTVDAIPKDTTQTVPFLFSDFSNPTTLEQAQSIKLYSSNEPAGLDFSFEYLEATRTIPFEFSPSLGIILCGSFFGVYKLRKRLQKN